MPRPDPKPSKNVALPDGFSDRLRQLREERNLSKTDLADQAGTTYRTIQNLETASHQRAQEKTLMGISGALGLTFSELIAPEANDKGENEAPVPTPGFMVRQARWFVATFVVVLLAAGWTTWHFAVVRATWTAELYDLRVYDAILGMELWHFHSDAIVSLVESAPWDESLLLVGLGSAAPGGGRLLALERATGRQVWESAADMAQLTRAVGEEMVADALMSCRAIAFPDIDGDGVAEILVNFSHGLYHPATLTLIGRDGTLLKQYANKGHLLALVTADLDGDGKDEVVGAGTNNAPAYNGPTLILLDEAHWRGASVDSLCNPWSSEPDSSLLRMVFPSFPPAALAQLGPGRLSVRHLHAVPQADGQVHLRADVRSSSAPDVSVRIVFDNQLRLVNSVLDDDFLGLIANEWPDSLRNENGPAGAEWRREWLGQASYFGVGQSHPELLGSRRRPGG